MATLVLMPVLSRWAMAYAIFAYPYAKPSGLGKAFKQGASWQMFVIATLIALVAAIAIAQLTGLAIMLGIWITATATAACLKRIFSGLTGDSYGAINEITEVSVLIFVIIIARLGLSA